MRDDASQMWRSQGDVIAFDHQAWEFKARQFWVASLQMLEKFDAEIAKPNFDIIMLLPTAEYTLCLALELLCKAHYLKEKRGPREEIYKHEVSDLVRADLLTREQKNLLAHAERYVIWAGRYPTPKWTKETYKEGYDVVSAFVDGTEVIEGQNIPNTASRPRTRDLLALYEHIYRAWQSLPGT